MAGNLFNENLMDIARTHQILLATVATCGHHCKKYISYHNLEVFAICPTSELINFL